MCERWWQEVTFYHIYPFGYCGAPATNDLVSSPVRRLKRVTEALDDVARLGCRGLHLGPVFESESHGYDTVDYSSVDRRLGTNTDLVELVREAHRRGIGVILDGVFNHVGREFPQFRDLLKHRQHSDFSGWFRGVDYSANNRFGDHLSYEGWEGNDDLVSLQLLDPDVRQFLLRSVRRMIEEFDIDGLRLDVAYLLPATFLSDLRSATGSAKNGFWLMGEVIHGDHAAFTAPGRLHSITNYECYKGLWSAHNDRNYFEIGHSLNRLFGPGGVVAGRYLYNFADNHDVDRVAASLANQSHLYPLYSLLFAMPGVPSIYYGSEWGVTARKRDGDPALRPSAVQVHEQSLASPNREVYSHIQRLTAIRSRSRALRHGDYLEQALTNEQIAFTRTADSETVLVVVNAADHPCDVALPRLGATRGSSLFTGEQAHLAGGSDCHVRVDRFGSRMILLEG